MKKNRTVFFIIIAFLALLAVIIIQVEWILQSAGIKEEIFNEKAAIVLTRTAETISTDKETCGRIGSCLKDDESGNGIERLDVHKIDSILRHFMALYNFHINYSFRVIKPVATVAKTDSRIINYLSVEEPQNPKKSLTELTRENGFELNLIFPGKENYIRAEMGSLFITSIILIIIVLVLFWRTLSGLQKEKKISEHATDFLNNMTHEFKTPLTNIALAGRMIRKEGGMTGGDKVNQYTDIILEENEKLRLQVEQVLNMTALEKGEIPLQKSRVNFHELIRDAEKCMQMQMDQVHAKFFPDLKAEMFYISGDKSHMINALCNLIDNSLKYSGDNPEIWLETKNTDKNLITSFRDNGIGIEKQYHKKVFDQFFRIPKGNVHNIKGFGLGLAYVKTIIEMHGGTIELISKKDKGTFFIITLPNA